MKQEKWIDAMQFSKDLEEEFHGMISDADLKIYQILQRLASYPGTSHVPVNRENGQTVVIYRNGAAFALTNDEMLAAYRTFQRGLLLEDAEDWFKTTISYAEWFYDEEKIQEFADTYGFTPEEAMDVNSPHYLMEKILQYFEDFRKSSVSEGFAWECAVNSVLEKKEAAYASATKTPVKIEFYAVLEDGLEYTEIREFQTFPSSKLLEKLANEHREEAEDMNDQNAVSYGHRVCPSSAHPAVPVPSDETEYPASETKRSIPDEMGALFGTVEGRKQLIETYGDSAGAFGGINQDGEQVILSIASDGMKYTVFQNNGWIRVQNYDEKGWLIDEIYDGRHDKV